MYLEALFGMHLSGCVLVPSLRKPGTEGLSLIGEPGMFPAGASFTAGSFATTCLLCCPSWMLIACDVAKQQWGGAGLCSLQRRELPSVESVKILPSIQTLGSAVFRFDLIACASGLRGIWEPASRSGRRSQQ